MRVLYYNWVDYLDDEGRGGGVSVYQRNLLAALDAQGETQANFLSSGISHDLFSARPRWERVRHGPATDRHRRYEIVNSGVLAPAHHSFGNPAQIDHAPTEAAFLDFVERTGPYDVVHFNNLEGLPVRVLEGLKTRWPATRVVLSLHNYYPVCPQVNLWYRERETCTDFAGGRKCGHCLPGKPDERLVRLANALAFNLKKWGVRPGTRLFDRSFLSLMRIGGRLARMTAARRGSRARGDRGPDKAGLVSLSLAPHEEFAQRRAAMKELVNAHCDAVLCVSARVAEVAARYGIAPDLLHTSYIGTQQAAKFAATAPRATILRPDGMLTLGYLGYMRRDKGFFFLLDALEALPESLARRIRLVVGARGGDGELMDRLATLSATYDAVLHADGYTHDSLDALLDEVDVGVVPVLWEDNLPQVAIEMHARHIPLLTSDLGGARELANCPAMVFEAGSIESFHARISDILAGRITQEDYWKNAVPPVSMEDHLAQLREIYACPGQRHASVRSAV